MVGLIHSAGVVPDLLLTDVVMPGMTGVALFRQLSEEGIKCKVLYMSGYTGGALSRYGEDLDPERLLEKPFTLRELERRVHEALGD